jgi:hypothetical protein
MQGGLSKSDAIVVRQITNLILYYSERLRGCQGCVRLNVEQECHGFEQDEWADPGLGNATLPSAHTKTLRHPCAVIAYAKANPSQLNDASIRFAVCRLGRDKAIQTMSPSNRADTS